MFFCCIAAKGGQIFCIAIWQVSNSKLWGHCGVGRANVQERERARTKIERLLTSCTKLQDRWSDLTTLTTPKDTDEAGKT